jgi:hypothetical protein
LSVETGSKIDAIPDLTDTTADKVTNACLQEDATIGNEPSTADLPKKIRKTKGTTKEAKFSDIQRCNMH